MQLTDILYLIERGEGLKTEFKEAKNAVPKSFYETVVSFSNTDGGTILFGVKDNGDVEGIDITEKVKLQKDIITALNSRDCINPPLYIQPYTVIHPKGEIMVIQIPASSQVHDYSGRIYSREFESDLDVTDNHQKVSELYFRKRNFFSESQIIPHLSITDLDNELFDKARTLIRNYRSDHPWLLVSDEQMLKDSTLWRKDFMNGQEGLTLAAALIFGKDATIQSILPAYKVEAMVRIQNTDRWDDRINPPLRTNLIDTYLLLKDFISKHLPEKFFIEGDQRIDLRDKIFREVIGNVIVHREYTSALSTEMIISGTEVNITNPNKPLFHGIIDPAGFNPYPKNPNIRKFFTAFGWTDEIGSGIRNTSKYLPLYSGGAKPVFWEDDTFKTIIPLKSVSLGLFANELHSWLELPTDAFEHVKTGLSGITLPADLDDSSWIDVLLHLVQSWHQKGIRLDSLNWPENQYLDKELNKIITRWQTVEVPSSFKEGAMLDNKISVDYQLNINNYFKQVPSSLEKGVKLLVRKSLNLISILVMTTEPVKIETMMAWMQYKKRQSFREIYLIPLQQAKLISKTNPEKSKDPNQKYIITPQGKAFLGGL